MSRHVRSALIELSQATLGRLPPGVAVPAYDRAAVRPGIVHFGVGNFHRTHQAVYLDACLHLPGQLGWGVVGVGLLDGAAGRAKAAAYTAQDCLYSVTEFAPDGGVRTRVVGAMVDYLHAPSDPGAVLARLAHPDTRIVTLTITEGGYNIRERDGVFMLNTPDVAHDLAGGPPRSAFGFLVEALALRRAAGLPGFAVASCDNLRGNGDTTRRAVLGFAAARDPDLAAWVGRECDFPNSMVDRIAPQVSEAGRAALNRRSGVADRLPATAETFTQWVVEDRFRQGRPALERVGVEFRDDLAAFVAVKGRMINACHMLLAYPAILCGYRVVHEAMADPRLVRLLVTFLDRDVIPHVEGPPGLSLEKYKAMVVDRFSNPAVGDQLLRIAGDGAAKLPVYHTKTVATLLAAGADLKREAFLLACFGRYLRARDDDAVRDDLGAAFEVVEPSLTPDDWARARAADPVELLGASPFLALGLADSAAFVQLYQYFASALARDGAARTLDEVLG